MKKFFKVSILILLAQVFFPRVSLAMDTEEHKKVSFTAHQQVFKSALGELSQDIKESIDKLPTIFIAYGWGEKDNKEHQQHAQLVEALATDLKLFGFPINYDLDVRCGGTDNIWSHADKIYTVDKVILIGSSHLKEKYEEEKGTISQEINLLRTRIRDKGLVGVIPLWFIGDIKDSFPTSLLHLPARMLERGSLIDIGYFSHFFELLMDIFHTETNTKVIGESIKAHKQEFIDTAGELTPEILQEYGLQIRISEEEKSKKLQGKLKDILGLNTGPSKKK